MRGNYFRVILLLSVAFFVGMVFLLDNAYKEAVNVSREHFADHHYVIAGQVARGLDNSMQMLVEQLEALSKEEAVRDMDLARARRIFERAYEQVGKHSVSDIALMDSRGVIRLPLRAMELKDKDFSFRGYYQQAKRLEKSVPVYEHVEFKGVRPGMKGIIIAVPVLSREGRFNGLVLFAVEVGAFIESLLSRQSGTDKTWVIDGKGNVLYHPDYPEGTSIAELTGGSESFREFIKSSMSGNNFLGEYVTPEGVSEEAMAHPASIAGQNWTIIVSTPGEEISDVIARTSQKYALGILLLMLGATGVVFMFKKSRDVLELRVAERTAELSEANSGLVLENAERRRAEESLRVAKIEVEREKRKTEATIAAIADPVFIISPSYKIIYQNEAARIITGGDAVGQECFRAGQGRDTVCEDCLLEKTFRDGQMHRAEKQVVVGGEVRSFEFMSAPVLGPSGEIVAGVDVGRDITERKRAEENRKKVIEAIPDLLFIINRDGTFVDFHSPRNEDLYVPPESIIGSNIKDLLPEVSEETMRRIDSVLETGERTTFEYTLRMPGGIQHYEANIGIYREDEAIAIIRNVTERKRAEEERREISTRLQTLFDAIPGSVFFKDSEGRVLVVNKGLEELSGSKAEEIIGKTSDDLLPADVAEQCNRSDEEVITSRGIVRTEEYAHGKIIETIKSPIFDDSGQYKGMAVLVFDITERKEVEEKLQRQRQLLNTVFETTPDLMYIKDSDGRYLLVNGAFEKTVGISREEIVGKTMDEILPGDLSLESRESDLRVLKGEAYHEEQQTVIDGLEAIFDTVKMPLRNADGSVWGIVGVTHDITERKRAEEELAYSEQFLKSIIDNEPECVKLVDAEGTLIDMNASGLEMIGAKSLEEVKGKNVYGLVAPEHREKFKSHVERVCRGEKSMMEFRAVGLKGRSIWLETHAVPFYDDREKRTLLLAVTRDITERKRAEAELREREKQLAESQRVAHIGSWQHNLTTNESVWSDELFRVLGLDPEKDPADFDMFFSMIHPEDQPMLMKAIRETLETGKHYSVDYRFRTRDGRTRILHAQAELITDETGTQKILCGTGQDITERKQAEEALRESEERYRRLFNSGNDGIVVHGITEDGAPGKFIEVNDVACRMYGYTKEELLELSPADMRSPESAAEMASVVKKLLAERRLTFETTGITKNGERFPVEISSQVLQFEDEPLVLSIVRDVTERKRAEESLHLLLKAIESLTVGITISDIDGKIIYTNPAEAEMHGYSVKDLIGENVNRLAPPELRKELELHSKSAPHSRTTLNVRKDGSVFPVQLTSVGVEGEDGAPLAIITVCEDITERKRAEEAIKEGKQYLENVLNSIQDGICILDMDCNILMVNPTMEKWYSHRAPVVGHKCYKIFMGSPEMCSTCPCEAAMVDGESCTAMVAYHGPDGAGGTLEIHAFPLLDPDTGEQKGVIEYVRDITDILALQTEAFRAAQLASVGELAAGVAHEINNPINGIINYAQMLANRLPEGGQEKDILGRIMKEGDRIADIVSALLTFTRDHGQAEEMVNIEEMVKEALSLTVMQLSKDGIDVRIDIPAEVPAVKVRRQHLEQVFLNIINNARHALNAKYPEGSKDKVLKIRGESMSDEEIPRVRISFTDHGVGIPSELLEKVTDPFFTTKGAGIGTGLGLSISRSIVENHGGRLSIESAEGQYTRVVIDLPEGETR